MSQVQLTLPMIEGQPVLPSTAKSADGQPRFRVPLLKELINTDGGVRYLVSYESLYGGYEASSRQFFDAHLEPGDVFVDVGAHWGTFSLSAATRHPGQIFVVAVEPHPLNRRANCSRPCGSTGSSRRSKWWPPRPARKHGMAQLRHASTMGHSLDEGTPGRADVAVLHVPVVSIDDLLDQWPELGNRRKFLKIDVEGYEYEVLSGARRLDGKRPRGGRDVGEGRLLFHATPARQKMARLLAEFARLGYTNYRFPSSEFVGPLVPFAPTPEVGNVFALAPDFERKPVYELPFEPRPPFNMLFATPADPATRARTTELLIEARSSDGARWANPHELMAGASRAGHGRRTAHPARQPRARPGRQVTMALKGCLPARLPLHAGRSAGPLGRLPGGRLEPAAVSRRRVRLHRAPGGAGVRSRSRLALASLPRIGARG